MWQKHPVKDIWFLFLFLFFFLFWRTFPSCSAHTKKVFKIHSNFPTSKFRKEERKEIRRRTVVTYFSPLSDLRRSSVFRSRSADLSNRNLDYSPINFENKKRNFATNAKRVNCWRNFLNAIWITRPAGRVGRGLPWARGVVGEECHGWGVSWVRCVMGEVSHGRGVSWLRCAMGDGSYGVWGDEVAFSLGGLLV